MLRALVVITLSAIVLALTVPNVWVFVDASTVGTSIDGHYDITAVVPGSPAAAAGLRVGDHVEPSSLTIQGKIAISGRYLLEPGESLPLDVDRDGRRLHVVVRVLRPPTASPTALVKRTTASIFIIVAATLLLLRPSAMLWGFFLFALGSTSGSVGVLQAYPRLWALVAPAFYLIQDVIAPIGLVVFATRFPRSSATGWRHVVEQATPWLGAALILLLVPRSILYDLGVPISPSFDRIATLASVAVPAIGISALLDGFVRLGPVERQRLRWVVAGFAIYFAARAWMDIAGYLPGEGWPSSWSNADWPVDTLNGLVIFIPLTVAYAVLKHHVLDLNFVIGRGLVYGIITSIAVAIFAIIDWFVGTILAQTKLAIVGEVVAAVAIGFFLNGLHHHVDRFVDAFIFRRRHLAERRLARVAAGLPHAESEAVVATMLVDEPVDALGLSCAALLQRDERGYACVATSGWGHGAARGLDGVDRLAVHLNGERGPTYLRDVGLDVQGLQAGDPQPTLAIPIFVRHELRGIALYGAHRSGEAIDPDEIQALHTLCTSAAAALDHLEAVEMRRRLAEAENVNAGLRSELQALRAT